MKIKPIYLMTFAKAIIQKVYRYITGEKVVVSEELFKKRLSFCYKCKFLEGQQCEKCGCAIKMKAFFVDEACPINKW